MRSGAGMVTLAIPASINNAVIRSKIPELMTLPLPTHERGYSRGFYPDQRLF